MQDLSKKIKFYHFRKKLWKSKPYKIYLKIYEKLVFYIIKNTKNKKVLFINGMRRSGNHYLMKTIMNSTDHTVFFFNNQRLNENLSLFSGFQLKIKSLNKLLIIVGYEDLFVNDYIKSSTFILNSIQTPYKNIKILIKRDIKNLMASRLNHPHMAPKLYKSIKERIKTKDLWLDHHSLDKNSENVINVRFNYIYDDLEPIDLSNYGIEELKENNKIMNRYGGGSSFDNNNYQQRYKKFKNEECFEFLIKDLQKISSKIHD